MFNTCITLQITQHTRFLMQSNTATLVNARYLMRLNTKGKGIPAIPLTLLLVEHLLVGHSCGSIR